MSSTFSDLSLTCLGSVETGECLGSPTFCLPVLCLKFISLFHPLWSLSLPPPSWPFHPTPAQVKAEGSARGISQSPMTYHHHQDWSHMVSTKMRGEAMVLANSTGMVWEHNPFCLHSQSLRWSQPASTKNLYSAGFTRASSHAFSISSTVFQEQWDSEVWIAFKNTFHVISCLQNSCSNLPLSSCLFLLIQLFLLCL